jgi:4-hydroxy-3-polyprenylbenzoate decarboxylase
MGYKSLADCVNDLEKHNHLIRISQEVDPHLEMAAIQLRVYENNGPAILFENVKDTKFRAVSNLFGSFERSKFMFRDRYEDIKKLIALKSDPLSALKKPLDNWKIPFVALGALPLKKSFNKTLLNNICKISDLPLIQHWPNDGGAFVTLPAVYTEDIDKPGIMKSNLGMYRIQLNGNNYEKNTEIGLHYQLHRGIGVHQTKSNAKGLPLKVSIFVGGPPAHMLSAVMPLPEGIPELTFAGALNNRRFRYYYDSEGFCINADADFVITGEVYPNENKPEGPFGDHLGYYSLQHDFPLMRVRNVYHKKDAIWPFTVVGRPPQEDTSFGALIHDMTGHAIKDELPGLHDVHAVDAAGVHPLLLAIGSERYTPYIQEDRRPAELLTISNHILGTGQLSLAKFLFIIAKEDNPAISTHHEKEFFTHLLERIDLKRDIHFYTKTSIDTLDYSGDGLNTGSKVVIAAAGSKKRELGKEIPATFKLSDNFRNPIIVFPGIIAIEGNKFNNYKDAQAEIAALNNCIENNIADTFPFIIICDDANFVSSKIGNWLWVTFTRANPSHDIYGINSYFENKHWCSAGPLIIDARIKPHHAPVLERDPIIEKKVDEMGKKGGVLHGII